MRVKINKQKALHKLSSFCTNKAQNSVPVWDTWAEPTLVFTSLRVPAADSHPYSNRCNSLWGGYSLSCLHQIVFTWHSDQTVVCPIMLSSRFLNFPLANSRWAVTQWSLGSSFPDQDLCDISWDWPHGELLKEWRWFKSHYISGVPSVLKLKVVIIT